jgi:hypothetical protein
MGRPSIKGAKYVLSLVSLSRVGDGACCLPVKEFGSHDVNRSGRRRVRKPVFLSSFVAVFSGPLRFSLRRSSKKDLVTTPVLLTRISAGARRFRIKQVGRKLVLCAAERTASPASSLSPGVTRSRAKSIYRSLPGPATDPEPFVAQFVSSCSSSMNCLSRPLLI